MKVISTTKRYSSQRKTFLHSGTSLTVVILVCNALKKNLFYYFIIKSIKIFNFSISGCINRASRSTTLIKLNVDNLFN